MFDIEKYLFLKKDHELSDNHIFIAGLARSGTTILLNAIYQSGQFGSLTYDDMPFILAPNCWAKIRPRTSHDKSQERAHGDNLKISVNSPEAFEEVFWKTFSEDSIDLNEFFKKFVSLILIKTNKNRYLSKNNQNIRRLNLIGEIFPRSKILILFRSPLHQALSLFNQHNRFVILQEEDKFIRNYMLWIGHKEFGLDYKMIHTNELKYPNEKDFNHWLEQWYLNYKFILKLSENSEEFYLISYESLCGNPQVWLNIKDLLGIEKEFDFIFKDKNEEIEQSFDKKLFEKCISLYDSMTIKSFGV